MQHKHGSFYTSFKRAVHPIDFEIQHFPLEACHLSRLFQTGKGQTKAETIKQNMIWQWSSSNRLFLELPGCTVRFVCPRLGLIKPGQTYVCPKLWDFFQENCPLAHSAFFANRSQRIKYFLFFLFTFFTEFERHTLQWLVSRNLELSLF